MAEIIIYHHLYNKKFGTVAVSPQQDAPAGYAKSSANRAGIFLHLSKFSALLGLALILFFYTPRVLALGETLINTTFENFRMSNTEIQTLKNVPEVPKPIFIPPFDPRLPVTDHLNIPSIGVTTDILEATIENYEAALKKGVWRASDFGAPDAQKEPVILAAHRFGYLAWTDSYRHKNSFYNLPKVEIGDMIEIDWNQRKYLYEVYATSKGTQILDYSADLILYTCETLTGDTKVFVYARLIQV